jgi:hypothetical protein
MDKSHIISLKVLGADEMRASQEFIKQVEELYQAYEQEVTDKMKAGLLKESAIKTYLYHSYNFVRWCKNDFVPGARNVKR